MIYLDNSATTRVFDSVIRAMTCAMQEAYFNPSALYGPGLTSDKALDKVRQQIAVALGDRSLQVVFTAGGTESNNLALRGLVPHLKGRKGHFITTAMEHPSVARVMESLQAQGHRVDYLSVEDHGRVHPEQLESLMTPDTTAVSIMQVNNETGAMQDLASLGQCIHKKAPQCLFHIDGVQGFMREPISLTQVGADLYSLSAHKIHGPKGVGALVMTPRARSILSPILYGGGQEGDLRSGTPNVPGILGLGQAVAAFTMQGAQWRQQMRRLKLHLVDELQAQLTGVAINGPTPDAGASHIINLSFDGIRGEVLLHALEGEGVLVSTGSACSSHAHKASGVLISQGVTPVRAGQAIRISLSAMTTQEEIDTAIEIIRAQVTRLARFKRR